MGLRDRTNQDELVSIVTSVDISGVLLFFPLLSPFASPFVFPGASPSSFAGVQIVHALTASAADVTAPDKLALAALDVSHDVRVVAAAAAQQATAIGAGGGPVAVAPPGAGNAPPIILQAVVWRLVEEDELLLVDEEATLILPPHLPPGAVHHLNAVLVALLQVRANVLECRHCLPTRLHGTGAGDAMTTAVSGHCPVNGLKDREEDRTSKILCNRR